jgi:hypothetical protein
LEIYEEFKKPSFDEKKIKDLILDLKTTDPNLKTQLPEEVINLSDKDLEFNFFDIHTRLDFTISGLALRAGILSKENKTLDCLKFLSDQNLVSKDHIAIIASEEEENLSVLGVTIFNVVIHNLVDEDENKVDENKTREIIRYYLGDKSQIEKAEAIVSYSTDPSLKEVTLSNYLVSSMDALTRQKILYRDAKSILKRFGLQFSDIFDEYSAPRFSDRKS